MINKFSQESTAVYFKESYAVNNEIIDKLWSIAETQSEKEELKRLGFIKNKFEASAGALTFAERKVNLEHINNSFDKEEELLKNIKGLTDKEKQRFLKEVKKAVDDKDYAALQKIKFSLNGKAAKVYADMMKEFFELGKKTASDEMNETAPVTSKDISGLYRAQSLELETKINQEVGTIGKEEAFLNIGKGLEAGLILAQVEKAMDQKLGKIINASLSSAMGGAFNTGRLAVFETYPDKIYGFQYTIVLDRKTTNLCLSLSGRVVARDDPDFYRLMPPNHNRCRSFWVEIMMDEFIKPKIGKIPESISRTNTGYTNFQDLQKVQVYKPEPGTNGQNKDQVVNDIISTIRERLKKQ